MKIHIMHRLGAAMMGMITCLSGVAIFTATNADATSCHKAYAVKGHYVAAHKVKAHYATRNGKRYYVKAYTDPRHWVRGYTVKSNCPTAKVNTNSTAYKDGWLDGVANEAATHEVPPKGAGNGSVSVVAYNTGWIAGETAYRSLYNRKAETSKDGSISNPSGHALAAECTSQYRDYAELQPCITQPHI